MNQRSASALTVGGNTTMVVSWSAAASYGDALDGFHVAQLIIARLHHPHDAEESAEFDAALGPINALADATTGFVRRLVYDDRQSSCHVRTSGIDDPLTIVNMSLWADLESLRHFVLRAMHLRRRREWFEASEAATAGCWWIPVGETPDLSDAYRRLLHLRAHGPTDQGWPLSKPVDSRMHLG